ncbi:MAG: ATP-dependent Clp protease adaptor ClpS [Syntrophales bacterium]
MGNDPYEDGRHANDLATDDDQQPEEPRMYRVLLHNDHYTTMEFVVAVLMKVFRKRAAEATGIMLDVHQQGKGLCGVYTYDVAATKIAQVDRMAKDHEFPLKCSYEEA